MSAAASRVNPPRKIESRQNAYRPTLGIAALLLFLLPVTMLMHNFWTIGDPQMHAIELGLWMRNMALAGAGLFLLAVPRPWPWSLDEMLVQSTGGTAMPVGHKA
ncbi:MAG: hypothetical protein R2867_37325 [Caldilineaceae bacterium]